MERPVQVVAVLGRGVIHANDPVAVADDLGLTRGDGCFDAARLVRGNVGWRIDHLDAHLARFARSCRALDLPEPDADAWRTLIAAAANAWPRPGDAVCKMVYTRGPEHLPGPPTGFVTIIANARSTYPIRVVTLGRGTSSDAYADAPWLLGGVKLLSYAVNMAAKRAALAADADDALFVSSDGYCLEGPTSGLLVRFGDTYATTPTGPTGILESCTLTAIRADLEARGVRVVDRLIRPGDLGHADGSWLVSAVRGVCEIEALDGRTLRQDAEVTARLAGAAGFDA